MIFPNFLIHLYGFLKYNSILTKSTKLNDFHKFHTKLAAHGLPPRQIIVKGFD